MCFHQENKDSICCFRGVYFGKQRAHRDLKYYPFWLPLFCPCHSAWHANALKAESIILYTKRTFSLPNTPVLTLSALQNFSDKRILWNQISKSSVSMNNLFPKPQKQLMQVNPMLKRVFVKTFFYLQYMETCLEMKLPCEFVAGVLWIFITIN